jgi:undecaprenyl-phosphate galactose phosphotransferase/putative colanic acid biosynthesis UDP-glucose lipid carrier transferase
MSQHAVERAPASAEQVLPALARATAADIFSHRAEAVQTYDFKRTASVSTDDCNDGRQRRSFEVLGRDLRSPLQLAADFVVIVALATVCGQFCRLVESGDIAGLSAARDCIWAGLTVALLLVILERFGDSRQGIILTNAFNRCHNLAKGWSLAFGALLFILFALKASADLSRAFLLSFYLGGLVVVGLWRALTPPFIAQLTHRLGYGGGEWIIVGDAENASVDEFVRELTSIGCPAPTVVRLRANCGDEAWSTEQARLLASVAAVTRIMPRSAIYVHAAGLSSERVANIGRILSVLPVATYVIPDAARVGFVRCKVVAIGTRIAIELRRVPMNRVQHLFKRAMDLVLASLALAVMSPFLIMISLIIRLDSAGPVLFRQARRGQTGTPFRIFKFRTMHVLEDGPVVHQALRDDPRVTRIGRFLRSSSLDELPQLLNVLNGDMSLVGPRPHAVAHDTFYAKSIANYDVRQHVKPGITGWAQVHGLRGATADTEKMRRRIEFDIWYAVNASLLLDCEILVRTLFEIFRRRNAY